MSSSTSRTIQYRPLPAAHRIHSNHLVRERALVGGIGSGKTVAGAWDSLFQLLEWNPGLTGMVVAPTYPMLQSSTKRTFFELLPPELIRSHNKTEGHLVLTNDSEVYFRSGDDPDKLRGPNLAWAWLDEGQEAVGGTGGVWDVLNGRLRASPTASMLLTGTPAGMNWVWEVFGKDTPQQLAERNRYAVRAKTADNFHLPPEYLAHLQATYVGDFARQELEGEFVAFAGLVYRDFRFDPHIAEPPAIEWGKVVAGVDFGFSHATAIVVVGTDYDGRAYVLDEFFEQRQTEAQIIAAARALRSRWNISEFHCDHEDPRLIQALQLADLPALPAIKDVIPGIQAVAARLALADDGRPRLYVAPHCLNLIRELQTYRYAQRPEGVPSKDAPVKSDDHAADALRYAVMGLDNEPFLGFIV